MDKLKLLKSEYVNELSRLRVTVGDLLNKKVPEDALKVESLLKSIYGDEIYKKQAKETILNNSERFVEKVSLDDISLNGSLKKVCELIDNSKFDETLDKLLRQG